MEEEKTKNISTQLPVVTYNILKKKAQECDISFSAYIRKVLKSYALMDTCVMMKQIDDLEATMKSIVNLMPPKMKREMNSKTDRLYNIR